MKKLEKMARFNLVQNVSEAYSESSEHNRRFMFECLIDHISTKTLLWLFNLMSDLKK